MTPIFCVENRLIFGPTGPYRDRLVRLQADMGYLTGVPWDER